MIKMCLSDKLKNEIESFEEKYKKGYYSIDVNGPIMFHHQEFCTVTADMMTDLIRFKQANPDKKEGFEKSLKRLMKLSEISSTYTFFLLEIHELRSKMEIVELNAIGRLQGMIDRDIEIEKLNKVLNEST